MKRSKKLQLALMSLTPITLTACGESPRFVEMLVYETLEQCASDGFYSRTECAKEFEQAQQLHPKTAPIFDSVVDCSCEYPVMQCNQNGWYYSPDIAAYLLPKPAHMIPAAYYLHDGMQGGYAQSLYRRKNDTSSYFTSDDYSVGVLGKSGQVLMSFEATVKPEYKTQVAKRCGFGEHSRRYRHSFGG